LLLMTHRIPKRSVRAGCTVKSQVTLRLTVGQSVVIQSVSRSDLISNSSWGLKLILKFIDPAPKKETVVRVGAGDGAAAEWG
jgi:hypothetical protein